MTRIEWLATAVLLAGATCYAAPARAQSFIVPDSVDAAVLAADSSGSTHICLNVLNLQPDSVVVLRAVPDAARSLAADGSCAGHNGMVVFVRDSEVTRENLDYLNLATLNRFDHLLVVCGGRRQGAPFGSPKEGAVPQVVPTCRVRHALPQRT